MATHHWINDTQKETYEGLLKQSWAWSSGLQSYWVRRDDERVDTQCCAKGIEVLAEISNIDLLMYGVVAVCGVFLSVSLKWRYYKNKKLRKQKQWAKGGEVLGFLFEKYRPHYSWEEFLGIIIFVSIVNVVFKIREKYFGKAKKKD